MQRNLPAFGCAAARFLHILCREGDETMPTNGLRYLRRVAALLAAGGVLAAGLLFALRAELPDTFVLEQGSRWR